MIKDSPVAKIVVSEKPDDDILRMVAEFVKARGCYKTEYIIDPDILGEKINILNASLFAMKEAVYEVIQQLKDENVLVLIDGNRKIKDFKYSQKTIIKGDSTSASIAAASILAKVSRDNYMLELDKKYPEYDFKKNKGYLTKNHIEAIKKFGITPVHRKSFLGKII